MQRALHKLAERDPMRRMLIAAATMVVIVAQARAQLIGLPSGQGSTPSQGAPTSQSLPSPPTGAAPAAAGGAEDRLPELQRTEPNEPAVSRENRNRELPEEPEPPVGPLR